mgnify:CR=1 FL=1
MATVDRGFLLLADLTGYTSYLARGELAHAPVIAGDIPCPDDNHFSILERFADPESELCKTTIRMMGLGAQ